MMNDCVCSNCYYHVRNRKNEKKCRNINSKYYQCRMALNDSCENFMRFNIECSDKGEFFAYTELDNKEKVRISSRNISSVKSAIQNIDGIRQNVNTGGAENILNGNRELKSFISFFRKELPDVYMELRKEFDRKGGFE